MNSPLPQPEFLPTSREEMTALKWEELDVLLISGDAYVDSHSFGVSLLGRWLVAHGYRTGIVAQPSWENAGDISRMGRPRLFAGISAGAMDSLIAHYTAFRKKRSQDAYSPGGKMDLRPNRAAIVYTGLARQAFPGLPVVLGGIEASLRRASHYDFWSDSLRRSILLDSKADAVLYGMAERSLLELAALFSGGVLRRRAGEEMIGARLRGSAYAVHPDELPADAEELPSHEAILADPPLLIKATMAFERQMLQGGPCLVQRSGGRAVVFEPPPAPLSEKEMDAIYRLPFTRKAHPSYTEAILAVAMMEGSVVSHRGCGGGCSFCSLASHQGRTIQSRSAASILDEVKAMTSDADWKGSVTDIGGPTSNMWGAQCLGDAAVCKRESCLFPKRCRNFKTPQTEQIDLFRRIARLDGVNHVRVGSGVRHDLAIESAEYMEAAVKEFTGGQLKIAPEHVSEKTLRRMRKPPVKTWETFIKAFGKLSAEAGKEQYIVPYLMSAFPGCTDQEMEELAAWLKKRGWRPQQVQCFIPSPGTVATAMFFSGVDPDGRPITVARTDAERLRQHRILMPDEGRSPARPDRSRPFASGNRPPFAGPRRRFDRPGTDGRDKPSFDRKPGFASRPRSGDAAGFDKRGTGARGGKPADRGGRPGYRDKPGRGGPSGGKPGRDRGGRPGGGGRRP